MVISHSDALLRLPHWITLKRNCVSLCSSVLESEHELGYELGYPPSLSYNDMLMIILLFPINSKLILDELDKDVLISKSQWNVASADVFGGWVH